MPSDRTPDRPDLDQLRRQAKELRRRANAHDPDAREQLSRHVELPPTAAVPLHLVQLALARRYGFRSWTRLVEQVRSLNDLRRDPLLDADRPAAHPLDDFLHHAVLVYGPPDGPARWAHALDVVEAHPELPDASVHAAAALADLPALRRHLAAEPASAWRAGGPLRWTPLLYLAYSRVLPAGAADTAVATARLLLEHGADPNDGFLWQGEPPPFTVLTGLFGNGEQGSTAQPPHPYAMPLARLLLDHGADPNDAQTLYNRMFSPANDHLELLFGYGLGTGDGGPWHRRMPDLTDPPSALLRSQLNWAVVHGMADRIRLLAAHGVDLGAPLETGHRPTSSPLTPVALARHSGRPEIARLLIELGAPEETLEIDGQLAEALVTGDRTGAERLTAEDRSALARVRRDRPSLLLRAAVVDSAAGVELLAAYGFDVNALGRQDVPIEEEWETALHHAAGEGKGELVRLLLRLGADPAATDRRFGATPLGWAEFFGHADLVELLRPRSEPG